MAMLSNSSRSKSSLFMKKLLGRMPVYILLLVGSILVTIPLVWTISSSLKRPEQVFTIPPQLIPNPFMWSNYKIAWTELPFLLFLKNTLIITLFTLVGQVISASLVAYGFARFNFKARNALFYVLLATMMLPYPVTMVSSFMIWNKLHAIDTFIPLILPSFFGGGAFTIFLLRQFFMTIPRDLDEAAMLDGCSYLGIWWKIILPLAKPALVTVVIFSFLGAWDDFMGPLIYLHSVENYTVSVGLNMFKGLYGSRTELLMAASLIHITPCIFLFFAAQKYFIKGIVMSGIKG